MGIDRDHAVGLFGPRVAKIGVKRGRKSNDRTTKEDRNRVGLVLDSLRVRLQKPQFVGRGRHHDLAQTSQRFQVEHGRGQGDQIEAANYHAHLYSK